MNLPPYEKKDKVQICAANGFPYLDMNMRCFPEGGLHFLIFSKNGHQLKYIVICITHTPGTLRVILWGLLNRLSKLTSRKT